MPLVSEFGRDKHMNQKLNFMSPDEKQSQQPQNVNMVPYLQEVKEALREKEEEVNILWNVLREVNKSKGSSVGFNMDDLQNMIKSAATSSH